VPTTHDKKALHDELVHLLEDELHTMTRAHKAVIAAATDEQAKPENDKDTRALEQSYLARGQAKRVEELTTGLAEVRAMAVRVFGNEAPIGLSALVTLETDAGPRVLFVAPDGGGAKLAGGAVHVVTPRSPLGRALAGKRAGDACEVHLGNREEEISVVRVV
jgi:transcription elongation GreA/GreB family factor